MVHEGAIIYHMFLLFPSILKILRKQIPGVQLGGLTFQDQEDLTSERLREDFRWGRGEAECDGTEQHWDGRPGIFVVWRVRVRGDGALVEADG